MPYKSNRMHIYLYFVAGSREPVSVPESESQLELKLPLQPGHTSCLGKYRSTFVCGYAHVYVVLVSACLHVCVELKKYDILSVKQALCQTNSHWLSYKRGIATLSCLPATPTSLQLQSLPARCSLPQPIPSPIAMPE